MENSSNHPKHSRSANPRNPIMPRSLDNPLSLGPPLNSLSPQSNKLNSPTKLKIIAIPRIHRIANGVRSLRIKYSRNTNKRTLQLEVQRNHYQTHLHLALHLLHILCCCTSLSHYHHQNVHSFQDYAWVRVHLHGQLVCLANHMQLDLTSYNESSRHWKEKGSFLGISRHVRLCCSQCHIYRHKYNCCICPCSNSKWLQHSHLCSTNHTI